MEKTPCHLSDEAPWYCSGHNVLPGSKRSHTVYVFISRDNVHTDISKKSDNHEKLAASSVLTISPPHSGTFTVLS